MTDTIPLDTSDSAARVRRFLDVPSASMPRFMADSTLLFLCDAPGSNLVFALPPGLAGAAERRTLHRDAATTLAAAVAGSRSKTCGCVSAPATALVDAADGGAVQRR